MNKTVVFGLLIVAIFAGFWVGKAQKQESADAKTDKQSVTEQMLAHSESAMKSPHVSKFSHFRVGNRNVKSMFADDRLIWIGTSGGVIRYDITHDRYQRFDTTTGLLANGIFYVGKLRGRLAVGTYGGGLSLMKEDGNGWDTYNVPEGLADAFVYDVEEGAKGDIWIATWSGLNRVIKGELANPQNWITYTVENTNGGLPNDWVYALDMDADGVLWIATEGGLARLKDDQWENWQHEDGLGAPYDLVKEQIVFKNDPAQFSKHHARQKQEMGLQDVDVAYNPNYIISLQVASDGSVWCGTWGGGLAHFDGNKWEYFTMEDGLPGNHVFMLHEDNAGDLWIGTSSGLAKRNSEGGFTQYGISNGLFSNMVFSMAQDFSGQYWVGSFGGVARISELK